MTDNWTLLLEIGYCVLEGLHHNDILQYEVVFCICIILQVKFLYDERKNNQIMDCLLDDGMKKCHGPALWAYNNAIFTNDDFENILKLGGATKEDNTTKIGKFGLGFNAVYNLTDVPSFISKEHIAILDPHKTHLGRALRRQKPGLKMDIQKNRKKMKRLSNQFKPFDGVFGCELTTQQRNDYSYEGTLFRFPLRTPPQAEIGDISKISYNHDKMVELLQKLLQSSESLLLFSQNILKMSVYHLKADALDGSSAQLLFGVNREAEKVLRPLSLPVGLSDTASKAAEKDKRLLKETNILRAATVEMQRSQYKHSQPVSSIIVQKVSIDVRPEGESLLRHEDEAQRSCLWATSSCMGTDECFTRSLEDKTLLPVGGVAVPVHEHQGDILPCEDLSGKVYCFLPLSIETDLQFHINGYFAVTSSRRYLCQQSSEDLRDTRGKWNDSLATDPICKAFINLLVVLADNCKQSRYDFTRLFPCKMPKGDVPKELRRQSLVDLVTTDVRVFTDGEKYASFSEICFIDPSFRSSEIGDVVLELLREFSASVVVDMSQIFLEALQEVGCRDQINSRMFTRKQFFEEIFMPNITDIDAYKRNLLLFKSITSSKEIDELVKSYACIPTEPTGDLKKPSELVLRSGTIGELYNVNDKRFPQLTSLTTTEQTSLIPRLVELGMKTNDLPWEDVMERAQSIVNEQEVGHLRSKSLINHMERKLKEGSLKCDEEVQKQLIHTSFLPVMKRPRSCPIAWKVEQTGRLLVTPGESYLASKKKVLCFVEHIVENGVISEYNHRETIRFLGFRCRNLSAEQLISQLSEMKKSGVKDWSELNEYVHEVYTELQKMCECDESDQNGIKKAFHEKGLLYMANEFRDLTGVHWKFLQEVPHPISVLLLLEKPDFSTCTRCWCQGSL